MDIHEYQAKEILARFGAPVPRSGLAYSPEQASYRAQELGGERWMVKAQIHSGGRGEAGGVKVCANPAEVEEIAAKLLGRQLVTRQTGPQGKTVFRLYIEEAADIAQEIYLGFVLDRKTERVMVVASAAGGMEIEQIAVENPDSILRMVVEPAVGLQDFQAHELAFGLGLDTAQIGRAVKLFKGAYRAFRDLDAPGG
jgi:malate-CoA ligase subunit beta